MEQGDDFGEFRKCVYNCGEERGRQAALTLLERKQELTVHTGLTMEMEARQEALPLSFVERVNAEDNAPQLWQDYKQGVLMGIQAICRRNRCPRTK